jgi:membrane fusion protein, heavy metal efflux system
MTARWTAALPLLLTIACNRASAPAPPTEQALPSTAATRWSERTELFVEHPVLVVGRPARFAIHFTDLHTFKPLTSGRAVVHLTGARAESFATDAPSSPGIFGVTVTPTAAGRRSMRVEVSGPLNDGHDLGAVDVFPTEAAARAGSSEDKGSEGISFLKEQQWSMDFATAAVERRAMRNALQVPGEVRPRTGGDAIVSAPVSGRVLHLATTATLGAHVAAGAALAEILAQSAQAGDRPTLDVELAEARARLQLAAAERSRSERLTAAGAVPGRRLQEAQVAEATARSRVEAAEARLQQLDSARTGSGGGTPGGRFVVRSPFAGVLTDVSTQSGVAIEQGAPLFRVVAIDAVDVIAQVPEADLPRLTTVSDADALAPGSDEPIRLGAPISRGRVLEPDSRTLPVVFRLTAPPRQLAIGQRLTVRLGTGAVSETLAIQTSAIVDDGGRSVVFVQTAGETFARRPVATGARDGRYVAVDGVTAGERVVVRGAPLVRLASMSSQVPAHGHVH